MPEQKSTETGISYFTPNHGKNESHLKVPESFKLHICPSACGRRFAIHALMNGDKGFVSCLHITETDIVSGHYEDIISEAIDDLLAELTWKPKAFILYFHCIDDFLGTDERALVKRLRGQYPFLHFAVCHMDPIAMEAKILPGMRIHSQIYGLLEYTGKKSNSVNFIGNRVPVDPESELFRVLSGWGIEQEYQRIDRKTFDEFLKMADSRLNLVLNPMAKFAAQNMAVKLDIPYLANLVSYDIDDIVRSYQEIAGRLGKTCPDFGEEIERTRQSIRNTREHIGNMPVIVDSAATCLPFGMAKALCRYGFNVQAVFYIRMLEDDWDNRRWMESHYPQIPAVISQNYELMLNSGFGRECLAIGYESGYILQADHFLDMQHDESFYGFHGVRKLMRLMCEAHDTIADWERIKEADKELKRL